MNILVLGRYWVCSLPRHCIWWILNVWDLPEACSHQFWQVVAHSAESGDAGSWWFRQHRAGEKKKWIWWHAVFIETVLGLIGLIFCLLRTHTTYNSFKQTYNSLIKFQGLRSWQHSSFFWSGIPGDSLFCWRHTELHGIRRLSPGKLRWCFFAC